jgi:gamma-glutamylputrescine oxidase
MQPVSGWLTDPPELRPALEQDLRADAVIVGAGCNGLSTALELRARGVDTVLLERGFAGSGASGRNAGYLAGGIGLELDLIIKRLGRDGAAAVVRFYDEALRHTERLFARHRIDCDYDATGVLISNVHPDQEARLRHQVETARELGAPIRFLTHPEMRSRGIPPAFLCGALSEIGGTLDPGKYVLGLRRAAVDAGVRLFEGSPVLSIDDGAPVRVRTPHGSVLADACVLATNAYTPSLGRLKRTVLPIRVSAIETEPLSPDSREALGWPRREGLVTAHYLLESYRLTRRGSVLVSTKRVDYRYGSTTPEGTDAAARAALEKVMRERLPGIGDTRVATAWSGWITFTGDTIPVIGVEGAGGNLFYATGCAGHGVATQTLMGVLLADRICGREHEWEKTFRRKVVKLPPEPLRWAMCKLLLSAGNLLDGRTDRRTRQSRPGTPRTP